MKKALLIVLMLVSALADSHTFKTQRVLHEVNKVAAPNPTKTIEIRDATLIDGRGGAPLRNATIIIQGNKIVGISTNATLRSNKEAEIIDARGMTLLPGLIDSHFHLDGDNDLPALYLRHGITSVRDPGAWIQAYQVTRNSGVPIPRLFLADPHLDSFGPAYPDDSIVVRDADEARQAVNRCIAHGASSIKVYFRLPLGLIKVVTETAHARGIPVTAHLEVVDAVDAINAGVDGIEHVTSFGTSLIDSREAEKYRQAVLQDNNARREGRYRMWSEIDLDSPRVKQVLELIIKRGIFVSATLAVFEKRQGDSGVTDMHVRGFEKMMKFVGLAKRAGAHIVVGSHSSVPHAERGWAYQREMELLVESGLTPLEAIKAASSEQARFFRIDERLGTIEVGKLADLILIEGEPQKDVSAMRRIKRVMLNGKWVN